MPILPDQLSPHQDDFYDALLEAHAGLAEVDSHALNVRLILILANIVGDINLLKNAIDIASSYQNNPLSAN